MIEFLLIVSVCSLTCSLILWRLLTAQNNKAQTAFASHRKDHHAVLAKTKAERRELKLLLNAFDDALVIIDTSGVIQVANEAAITLCEGRSMRGKSYNSAFRDASICEHIEQVTSVEKSINKKLILQGSSFGNEQNIENTAWIIDSAPLPLQSHDEEVLYRIILRNVTAEHRTDTVKREFVANASHELRTPLAIITGYLENLIDDDVVESPTMSRKILTTIRKHSDRISKLIDEMLTISKLESGETAQLSIQPFSLNEVLGDIVDRLSPLIISQKAQVDLVFDPEEITLTGDQFYWDQALFNLIENALKQNADIAVTVKVQTSMKELEGEKQFQIKVTDNGKGIPAAHLPYVFNRFYRVQKHHSQNEIKGTGLGLSIVKHAIEAHGGTITATSEPGISTSFLINV